MKLPMSLFMSLLFCSFAGARDAEELEKGERIEPRVLQESVIKPIVDLINSSTIVLDEDNQKKMEILQGNDAAGEKITALRELLSDLTEKANFEERRQENEHNHGHDWSQIWLPMSFSAFYLVWQSMDYPKELVPGLTLVGVGFEVVSRGDSNYVKIGGCLLALCGAVSTLLEYLNFDPLYCDAKKIY